MIGSSIGYRGDGFVRLNHSSLPQKITIVFSTEDQNSLLVTQGRNDENSLTVTVSNGHLKLSLFQNGDFYGIQCDVRINDGQLHTLTLEIKAKTISLILDGKDPITQEIDKVIDFQSDYLFIGGKIQEFLVGKPGFRGCIYQIIVDTTEIDFSDNNNSLTTANIVPCLENVVLEDYYYESLLDENMDDFDEDAYLERLGRMNEI
eukprot:04907.XXX_103654_102927_1 [CDS] Oithona nana genome sequencing.